VTDPGICSEHTTTRHVDTHANHHLESRFGGASSSRQAIENRAAKARFRRLKPTLPALYDCMLGYNFARLVAEGRLYPYPLEQRKRPQRELPTGAKWKLRDRHYRALGFVVAAHLGCGTEGLIITHLTMAGLLDVSTRTAGSTMRELAAWGFVSTTPWFSDGADPLRQASLYRVTAFARDWFAIAAHVGARARRAQSVQAGEICQAEVLALRANPEKVVAAGEDAAAVVRVPDVTTEVVEAEGVKPRSETPHGSAEPCRANRPLVRVRSGLGDEVSRLVAHQVGRVREQLHAQAHAVVATKTARLAAELDAAKRRGHELAAELARSRPQASSPAIAGERARYFDRAGIEIGPEDARLAALLDRRRGGGS